MLEIKIIEDVFGKRKIINQEGAEKFELIRRFTLSNQNGMIVQVINYGATITSLKVPDKNGHVEDLVLGFDTIEEYMNHSCYFGATIGRCANRIANGKFIIKNKEYSVAKNEGGKNHLHGGNIGFDKVIWESHVQGNLVTFIYNSFAMEEGYPGTIRASVSFELTPLNELIIHYKAQDVSETTLVNMTNHSYFNLAGHGAGSIKNHKATILSDTYLPIDNNNIPTGEIASVSGTIFDLRTETPLVELSNVPGGGYDHNYCLKSNSPNELRTSVVISEPNSGRKLEVLTNQPGIQFYTANFLPTDTSLRGKMGVFYQKHGAFCLETQNYPNAVNQENFPSGLIHPGEIYSHRTILKFSNV